MENRTEESKMPFVVGLLNMIYGGILFLLTSFQLITFFSSNFNPKIMNEEVETMLEIVKELKTNPVIKGFSIFNTLGGMGLYLLMFLAGIYLIKRFSSGLTLSRISSIGLILLSILGMVFTVTYYLPHFKALAENYGVSNPEMLASKIKIGVYIGICFLFYPVVLFVLTFSKSLKEALKKEV